MGILPMSDNTAQTHGRDARATMSPDAAGNQELPPASARI